MFSTEWEPLSLHWPLIVPHWATSLHWTLRVVFCPHHCLPMSLECFHQLHSSHHICQVTCVECLLQPIQQRPAGGMSREWQDMSGGRDVYSNRLRQRSHNDRMCHLILLHHLNKWCFESHAHTNRNQPCPQAEKNGLVIIVHACVQVLENHCKVAQLARSRVWVWLHVWEKNVPS